MKRVCVVFAVLSLSLLHVGVANAASASTPANHPDHRGEAKGHAKNEPGKTAAPDQMKKSAQPPAQRGGADPARGNVRNENPKITFCHVPPGNPANGHLITTSVNAIQPGHTGHSDDIIPPFTFVKHGRTVSFSGQNWDADGQAALANGCRAAAAVGGRSGQLSLEGTSRVRGAAVGTDSASESRVGSTGSEGSKASGESESGFFNSFLPEAGGPRIALLVAGLGLVAGGGALLWARRRDVIG